MTILGEDDEVAVSDNETDTDVDIEVTNDDEQIYADDTSEEEISEADAEAAFEAGYEASLTGNPVEIPDEEEGKQTQANASKTEDGTDDDSTAAAPDESDPTDGEEAAPNSTGDELTPAPDMLTKAQAQELIDDALANRDSEYSEQIRKLNGKFGELNSRLSESGKPKELTKEQFKRLGEEYDEIAELLADDLSGIISEAPGVDLEQLLPQVQEQLAPHIADQMKAVRDDLNERFLNFVSDGWQDKIASQEYGQWLDSLSPTQRESVEGTEDPFAVAKDLQTFDSWQTNQQQAAEEAAAKAAKAEADKQKRLQSSEPAPSGGQSPNHQPLDEEALMEAGFNRAG